MVKIKDFTLASKNLGAARALVPYSTPAHGLCIHCEPAGALQTEPPQTGILTSHCAQYKVLL